MCNILKETQAKSRKMCPKSIFAKNNATKKPYERAKKEEYFYFMNVDDGSKLVQWIHCWVIIFFSFFAFGQWMGEWKLNQKTMLMYFNPIWNALFKYVRA